MGLWLEIKEKTMCLDERCVAQAVVESALEKIGIKIHAQTEIEEHATKLVELIEERHFDEPYTFTITTPGHLKISVYDITYDVIECHLEGCEGYVTASVEVEGDIDTMREIAKAMIRNMGIDKYVKICE